MIDKKIIYSFYSFSISELYYLLLGFLQDICAKLIYFSFSDKHLLDNDGRTKIYLNYGVKHILFMSVEEETLDVEMEEIILRAILIGN